MSETSTYQYTIRNVPAEIDAVLRERARELGKSLNQVLLDALSVATNTERPARDLSDVVGSMSDDEGLQVDTEIRDQRRIDPKLWP